MRRTIRSLAWFTVVAQVAFVASWLVAGARQPNYSHARSGVSALAAHGMRDPWIAIAGMALLGLSALALVPGVLAALPRRRSATVAAVLLGVTGAGFIVAAFARMDCDFADQSCVDRFHAGALSWQTDVHLWTALAITVAIVASVFAISRALWPSPTAAAALGAGLFGGGLWLLGELLYRTSGPASGATERVQLLALQLWLIIVATGILHETRGAPRLPSATPLRPRDFFGSAWAGTGQVQARPYVLTRRFGPCFALSRETTWKSDDVGIVVDRATFADGRVEERSRYARLVDPAHIHISGDDMPEGTDVVLDEDGYRIAPYRALVPIGPLRFLVTCRDDSRIEPDGTLAHTVHVAWHGLPVARLVMRARPVDTSPAPGASPAAPGSPVSLRP